MPQRVKTKAMVASKKLNVGLMTRHAWIALAVAGSLMLLSQQSRAMQLAALPDDLSALSLEDLLDIQVTSVSRVAEDLSHAAAAIQVITAEEIRRSGARNIPDVLRLATGLQVAQHTGRTWAITSRGFNSTIADKLEVRLDGRSIYTPLFSGVTWEVQEPPLEEIARIEIIRGPGAALWGANAVNGVINIITHSAEDSQGSEIAAHAGSELKQHYYAKTSGKLGAKGHWRLYAKMIDEDPTQSNLGEVADARELSSLGWRGDWELNQRDELSLGLNGQMADMGSGQALPGTRETINAADLNLVWKRKYNDKRDLELRFSLDHWEREIPGFFDEIRDQLDIDVRYRWNPAEKHDVLIGATYRRSSDEIGDGVVVFYDPPKTDLDTIGFYVQDRIQLADALTLTVGSKFEHNDFTGFEYQPSIRFAWLASDDQTFWGSVSRATRSPNRTNADFFSPTFNIIGNRDFESERAVVTELGWRRALSEQLSIDVATYYADYRDLQGLRLNQNANLEVGNEAAGRGYGLELSSLWAPHDDLKLWLNYSYLNLEYHPVAGSTAVNIETSNDVDPRHQVGIRIAWDINRKLNLHAHARHIGELPDLQVPSYEELDIQLNYSWNKNWRLELGGRNLLNDEHVEFENTDTGSQLERQWHAGVRWSF